MTKKIQKRWKPKYEEKYFCIILDFNDVEICIDKWLNFGGDEFNYRTGNCFRTRKEAMAKLKKIKEILEG